jgi:hypothetical protein
MGAPGTDLGAVPGAGDLMAAAPALSTGLGGTIDTGAIGTPGMLGDHFPMRRFTVPGGLAALRARRVKALQGEPIPPDEAARSLLVPSVRGYKMADNMSPVPQDRILFGFNYFNDANAKLNEFFEAPIKDMMVYRYIFGLEKTFFDGRGSLGLLLPLNSVTAESREPGLDVGGSSTALGNMTVFGKYIVDLDPDTGSLWSVGLAISPETGPARFADADFLPGINSTYIQPFMGFLLNWDPFYLQGFQAIDVPATDSDAVMLYTDIGLGYFLYRAYSPNQFITAMAPTFETHVNIPVTHRGEYNLFDPAGTPDVVDLTYGFNTEFFGTAVATVGFVTPVTGPRPFDFEVVALLNFYFGGSRNRIPGRALTRTPAFPIVGG